MVHVLGRAANKQNVLQYRNLVCSYKTWDAFHEYMENRDHDIEKVIQLQRASFNNYLSIYKDPEFILLNTSFSISAPLRCDLALMILSEGTYPGFSTEKILNQFSDKAYYVLKGCPIYREYCLHFVNYLNSNNTGNAGGKNVSSKRK